MDFPKSIESETDRRKVHELASRSMGVRRRVRENKEHARCQNANLSMSSVFLKKNASRQSVWASMSVITSRNFHKLAKNM